LRLASLVVDTDNALGSRRGDVDDAFALAALLAGHLPVAAVASVGGNTGEAEADRNNRRLGALCGYRGRYLRGVAAGGRGGGNDAAGERIEQASDLWSGARGPLCYLALGPLTNLAAVLAAWGAPPAIAEVVLVGGNASSRGRFPPWWPHEFNLTQDRGAARAVLASDLPLTLVPLDVARRLQVGPADLAELPGPLGRLLREGSARWLRRARRLHRRDSFAVFDLLAAAAVLDPDCVERAPARVRVHRNLWLELGADGEMDRAEADRAEADRAAADRSDADRAEDAGAAAGGGWRPLQVVRAFDRPRLWRRFVERIAARG
jgi:inosine-uridine nucleoside N-ribohydrolase